MKLNAVVIHKKDNVAVALKDIGQGESVILETGGGFRAIDRIPYSHKILLKDIACGEDIIKYGEVIGQAGDRLQKGAWVHTHNMKMEGE
jgi:altronate dehydratase